MDENEFRTCLDPQALLLFVRRRVRSPRKRRLFACGCIRLRWDLLTERSREGVVAAEAFADGLIDDAQRDTARRVQRRDLSKVTHREKRWMTWAVQHVLATAHGFHEANVWRHLLNVTGEIRPICDLVRHVFGNPFQPLAVPKNVSAAVLDLAAAVYGGEDAVFALHDSLLEVGLSEIAEHFTDNRRHYKGCAVLDALLRKS